MSNDLRSGLRPIERWPLSDYTSQRQIEGWSVDEENADLNNLEESARRAFLEHKNEQLGREATHRYFKKLGVPIRGKILEQGAGICWLSSYLSRLPAVEQIVSLELSEERIQ